MLRKNVNHFSNQINPHHAHIGNHTLYTGVVVSCELQFYEIIFFLTEEVYKNPRGQLWRIEYFDGGNQLFVYSARIQPCIRDILMLYHVNYKNIAT